MHVTALLLAAASPPPASVPMPERRCPAVEAVRAPAPARAQPLGELPAADHVRAVDRRVDGCPAPEVLRTGVR